MGVGLGPFFFIIDFVVVGQVCVYVGGGGVKDLKYTAFYLLLKEKWPQ